VLLLTGRPPMSSPKSPRAKSASALRRRVLRAAPVCAGLCATALLALAGPASAHVKVFSDDARQGRPATLRFRVPSERTAAVTVRVDVTFPEDVAPASVPPVGGWTDQVERPGPDGRTHVVWTARAGHEIASDDARSFTVEVAPLPKDASVSFDAAQTYSDGYVVDWDEAQHGTAPPAFPAPVLVLDAAAYNAEQARAQATGAAPRPSVSAAAAQTASASGSGSGTGSWLPWTVAGVALAAAAGTALVRRGKSPAPSGHRS
jgi:uncharacterized protein YcnI